MSNLIDRQAAIEAFRKELCTTDVHREYAISFEGAKRILTAVPSAQPDILTCEDCKYADDKPISDGRHWCSLHGSFMYYCSRAERREEGGE